MRMTPRHLTKSKTASMTLVILVTTVLTSSLLLSGCQATKGWLSKHDDGSLTYQSSKKLAPIKLPANQETANFTPLYPTPRVGVNTLELKNAAGKQYQLPKPERAIQAEPSNLQAP